ncbi:MAG: KamA family radical SAM protein [Syntrophorhabdaceae bacterium]|nr:KamA family radical SAM protein [Syntrophorhabdaceae bacterium]
MHGRKTEGHIFCPSSKALSKGGVKKSNLPLTIDVETISRYLNLNQDEIEGIVDASNIFPFKLSAFYLNLIDRDDPYCPIRRQAIPSIEELSEGGDMDPFNESQMSHTPFFIKRYPKRGVLLTSLTCAVHCRFCNRRRVVGKTPFNVTFLEESFRHIEKDREIEEVILSGGDPFMLSPEELGYVIDRLKGADHIKNLRISSRIPVVSPDRITPDTVTTLKKRSPLWIVIHINHPKEITPEFDDVVRRFREGGLMMVSQTVLLRGVNDCPHILARLFEQLVYRGIKPYYLFQIDEVQGVSHFKVKIKRGIEIMRSLRQMISGLAIPHYVIDLKGGLGKAPVDYRYIKGRKGGIIHAEGVTGKLGTYIDDGI